MLSRKGDDYPLLPPDRIDFMDVAPEQLVSIAAALIPFLEHDDANRALMGSNMQRQSVPLLFPQAPLVGTGLEEKVARDSGAVIIARRAGMVTRVTADEIIVDAGTDGAARGRPAAGPAAPARPLPGEEVLAHQPGHRHQPAAPGAARPAGGAGRDHRRRRRHRRRRAGARQQRAGGVHALVRAQLRGRHRPQRAAGEGRRLLVDPHPGARAARPRHQARARRRSPAKSPTSPTRAWWTSTSGASSGSAPT